MTLTAENFREVIGDPNEIAAEMDQFRCDAEFLSERADLVDLYPERWIAVYGGVVQTDAADLEGLIEKIDAMGLPRGRLAVRFMTKSPLRLIL